MSEEAPGWDAIDGALRRIYGSTPPHHYAAVVPMAFGGNEPLQGISAYRSELGGRAHWHLVTYGYSELFEKETDDPTTSGYGCEMTMRVIDPEHVDAPPPWALSLLQNLARYVFRTGNVFAPNQYSTLNGPIALGRQTALVAAGFVADPELPAIDTPHGRVRFVQLVGLTADEYDAIRAWDAAKFLEQLATKDRAWTTDLTRKSWLEDPELLERVREGTARDGSSMGGVYCAKGSWDPGARPPVLAIAANVLADLGLLLRGRLARGREAALWWPGGGIELAPGERTECLSARDGLPRLVLDAADRAALLALPVRRGDYPLPSGAVVVRVVPIEIFDGTRTRVERVIG